MAYNPPIGSIYHLYTTYILPSGGLYATYHLLGEPETTIDTDHFWSLCFTLFQSFPSLKSRSHICAETLPIDADCDSSILCLMGLLLEGVGWDHSRIRLELKVFVQTSLVDSIILGLYMYIYILYKNIRTYIIFVILILHIINHNGQRSILTYCIQYQIYMICTC